MSYIILRLQDIIKNLKANKNISLETVSRIADFEEFARTSTDNKDEQKDLIKLFNNLSKQQKDFSTQEDIIYTLLKEILSIDSNKK